MCLAVSSDIGPVSAFRISPIVGIIPISHEGTTIYISSIMVGCHVGAVGDCSNDPIRSPIHFHGTCSAGELLPFSTELALLENCFVSDMLLPLVENLPLNVTWRTIPCRVVLCVTFNVCAKSDKDGFDFVSQDSNQVTFSCLRWKRGGSLRMFPPKFSCQQPDQAGKVLV